MPSQRCVCLLTVVMILSVVGLPGVVAEPTESNGFVIDKFDAPETVTAGDTLVVNATVRNTGSETDSQQIHLKNPDDEIVDSIAGPPLTLAPGETETVTLDWEPTAADIGTGAISVQSDDDYPHRSVTVVAPPPTETTVGSINETVRVGEPLSVPISVTNTGDEQVTSDLWVALNDSTVTNRTVTVDPGETAHAELTWTPTDDDVGARTLTAGTDATHTSHTVTVVSSETESPNDDNEPTDDGESDDDGEGTDDEASTDSEATDGSSGGSPPNVADRLRAPITDGTATFPGGDVRRVAFADEGVAGDVVATRFTDRPDGVDGLATAVGYYRISVPEAAADRNATIRFQLSTRALGTTNSRAVGVSHRTETGWEPLPATASSTDDGMEIAADTEGFSMFAVTVDESAAAASTNAAESATTSDDGSTASSDGEPAGSDEQSAGAASTAPPLLGAGGLALLVGVGSLLVGTRRRFRGR